MAIPDNNPAFQPQNPPDFCKGLIPAKMLEAGLINTMMVNPGLYFDILFKA
jgi:hypothetical protein